MKKILNLFIISTILVSGIEANSVAVRAVARAAAASARGSMRPSRPFHRLSARPAAKAANGIAPRRALGVSARSIGATRALGMGRLFVPPVVRGAAYSGAVSVVTNPVQQKRNYSICDLKGLYTSLPANAKNLSPVHGAAFLESGWVENFYKFGCKKHATHRLLADPKVGLFFLHENQFRPTEHKTFPGYSLTPDILGDIMGHLKNGTLRNSEVQDQLILKWRNKHKELTGGKSGLAKTKLLIDLINESEKECSEFMYPSNMTQSLLLAFLYGKVGGKQGMVDYLTSLSKHVPGIELNTLSVRENFSDEDVADIVSNSIDPKNFEQGLFSLIKIKKYSKKIISPKVVQGSYGYKGKPSKPDCVETALREIMNHLFFNKDTGCFDKALIPSSVKVLPELEEFYKKHNTVESVRTEEAGQAWMDLVSGYSNVVYNQGNYEIRSGFKNMLTILNEFFCNSSVRLEDLSDFLSDDSRKVTFSSDGIKGDYGYFNLSTSDGTRTKNLKINVNEGHAYAVRQNETGGIEDRIKVTAEDLLQIGDCNVLSMLSFLFRSDIESKNIEHWHFKVHSQDLSDSNVLTKLIEEGVKFPESKELIKDLLPLVPRYEHHWKRIFRVLGASFEYPDVLRKYLNDIGTFERLDGRSFLCSEDPEIKKAYLVAVRPELNTRNFETDLSNAMTNLQLKYAKILLELGVCPNILYHDVQSGEDFDAFGRFLKGCFHSMHKEESIKMIKLLLEFGVDSNGQSYGCTPLIRIALDADRRTNYFTKEVLKALIKAGADVNAQDGDGRTALSIFEGIYGCEEMVEILRDAGAIRDMDFLESSAPFYNYYKRIF